MPSHMTQAAANNRLAASPWQPTGPFMYQLTCKKQCNIRGYHYCWQVLHQSTPYYLGPGMVEAVVIIVPSNDTALLSCLILRQLEAYAVWCNTALPISQTPGWNGRCIVCCSVFGTIIRKSTPSIHALLGADLMQAGFALLASPNIFVGS